MNPIEQLTLLIVRSQTMLRDLLTSLEHGEHDERGVITLETVLWVAFVVLIVGTVGATLRGFIEGALAAIRPTP